MPRAPCKSRFALTKVKGKFSSLPGVNTSGMLPRRSPGSSSSGSAGVAQCGEERTFSPRLGRDGVAAPGAAGGSGAGDVPGEGLPERSEEPSLFWFLSNHFFSRGRM